MSSVYRPNVNNINPGTLTTMPNNLTVDQLGKVSSSCEPCTSIYETMSYRSAFDKQYVPIYQSRLALFDTNPLNLKFQK